MLYPIRRLYTDTGCWTGLTPSKPNELEDTPGEAKPRVPTTRLAATSVHTTFRILLAEPGFLESVRHSLAMLKLATPPASVPSAGAFQGFVITV